MSKEHYPDIPVVLTSGVARMSKDASDLRDQAGFLSKPYDHSLLAERIKQLIAQRDRSNS